MNQRTAFLALTLVCILLTSFGGAVAAQDGTEMVDATAEEMAAQPDPLGQVCTYLPDGIEVYSNSIGVQCQQVGGGGIGVQAIVDYGFIDAVDVYGPGPVAARVCFAASGDMIFLDATTSPRAVSGLDEEAQDDLTCANIPTAGTVVIRPAEEVDTETVEEIEPVEEVEAEEETAVEEEEVTVEEEEAVEEEEEEVDPATLGRSIG